MKSRFARGLVFPALLLPILAGGAPTPSVTNGPAAPARPQTPKEPFPYAVETVTFPGSTSGARLVGTLTTPKTARPSAALVLAAGTGRFDRDEVVARHRIFLVWSDYFTRRGFAVLRYDKRGIGESTGDFNTATDFDFADDARRACEFLRAKIGPDVKCGLLGHSGGTVVASLVAARAPEVSFIVLVGARGVPGREIILTQDEAAARAEGMTAAAVAKKLQMDGEALALVAREKDSASLATNLAALLNRQQPDYPATKEKLPPTAETVEAMIAPWFREYVAYDPIPTLRKVSCPVLVIAGSLDHQVFPGQNLPSIESALKAGGNRDFTIKELPGLNHLLQEAPTGASSEYGSIEQTASPAALELIADWIAARAVTSLPNTPPHSQ